MHRRAQHKGAALVIVALASLSACVSSPAPIVYGPSTAERLRLPPEQGPFQPNAYLRICPGMRVSNAPPADDLQWVVDFKPLIVVDGVVVATIPVNDACLSSGFGLRDGRPHHGIDVSVRPAGMIYAAAPGLILEAREASGYGLQILLDHGEGVHTRYAHLEYFEPAIMEGELIGFGQPLGRMGQTGNAQAIHLHFEILTGNYDSLRGSKGLLPRDPFGFAPFSVPGS
jgi:murein DD-endopeptidase MepM/ murein hydrolase activator NlpD